MHRTRTLAGLREYPKYLAITLFGALRERIAERGAELHAQGRIDAAQDVFFLDFEEMRATHADLRQRVAERKAEYEREMRRRPSRASSSPTARNPRRHSTRRPRSMRPVTWSAPRRRRARSPATRA
ncbi:hypothetical protein ACFQ0Q_44740 [Streptomyces aureus]